MDFLSHQRNFTYGVWFVSVMVIKNDFLSGVIWEPIFYFDGTFDYLPWHIVSWSFKGNSISVRVFSLQIFEF